LISVNPHSFSATLIRRSKFQEIIAPPTKKAVSLCTIVYGWAKRYCLSNFKTK
jgi:hypothetical protein